MNCDQSVLDRYQQWHWDRARLLMPDLPCAFLLPLAIIISEFSTSVGDSNVRERYLAPQLSDFIKQPGYYPTNCLHPYEQEKRAMEQNPHERWWYDVHES